MGLIQSGATADLLTVDAVSKAARVSLYDTLGTYRGPKVTYRASVADTVVAAAGTGLFFVIEGSASKTIIVQRISVSCQTMTAVEYHTVVVGKYSTAASGGTATTLTKVPVDSSSAAASANTCQVYTAAPTAGALVGAIGARRILAQATTAVAASFPDFNEIDFRVNASENTGITLRGTAQGLGLNFGSAPATAVTVAIEVEWTEE